MTTAAQTRGSGSSPGVAGRVVRRALAATVLLGLVLAAAGGLISGSSALAGVLVGILLVGGFFGFGTAVLVWVTRVSPAASLFVGLMTYTLQVAGLALAFTALRRSDLLGTTVDATWLGLTVIAGTLVWLGVQLAVSLRARQPIYDLPEPQDGSPEGRSGPTDAGAR